MLLLLLVIMASGNLVYGMVCCFLCCSSYLYVVLLFSKYAPVVSFMHKSPRSKVFQDTQKLDSMVRY